MPILLLFTLLKGPARLRAFVLLSFGALLLFACASAAHTMHLATERPVPPHVTHGRQHAARSVRS